MSIVSVISKWVPESERDAAVSELTAVFGSMCVEFANSFKAPAPGILAFKTPSATTKCEGVTAKGKACSRNACEGSTFCKIHSKEKVPKKEKKAPKKKEAKKEPPTHNHEIGETSESCDMCDLHGDIATAEVNEVVFEPTEDRLNDILSKCGLVSDEEDEDDFPHSEEGDFGNSDGEEDY